MTYSVYRFKGNVNKSPDEKVPAGARVLESGLNLQQAIWCLQEERERMPEEQTEQKYYGYSY